MHIVSKTIGQMRAIIMKAQKIKEAWRKLLLTLRFTQLKKTKVEEKLKNTHGPLKETISH